MKTFFIYILCITLPSLMLANSQLAIVGKTYNSLRMIGDEEYRNEVMRTDMAIYGTYAILGGLISVFGSLGAPKIKEPKGSLTEALSSLVIKGGGKVYIDDVYKGQTQENSALIVNVSAGKHKVLVIYQDDDYISYGEIKASVGDGVRQPIVVNADNVSMTKEGYERKKQAKEKAAEVKRQRELKNAEEARQRKIIEAEKIKQKEIQKRHDMERMAKLKEEGVSKRFKAYQAKFYRDGKLDVVIDPTTNLMWQDGKSIALANNLEEANNYCKRLNYAGFKDWRMPVLIELETTVDNSKSNPMIADTFKNLSETKAYWSSTLDVRKPNGTIIKAVSYIDSHPRPPLAVRCVRDINK